MSELMRHEPVTGTLGETTWSGLRVVPDPAYPAPVPLGQGVLAPESDLDQEMVVRRRVPVTHDVLTLVLQPTLSSVEQPVAFAPGQYVTIGLEVDGRRVERCYTISSPPTRPHLLTLTVKRIPGGEVSSWLHDRVQVGDRLTVRGPMGGFSVCEHPASRYLLLSAGSGVTPTLSTLRTMADLGDLDGVAGSGADVVVVHSARSYDDLVCRAELDGLAAAHDGLRVHWVCEDAAGRLGPAMLTSLVPDLTDREVFTCGPLGYMGATRALLADLGVDPARCHEESFVLGTPGAPAAPPAPAVAPVAPEVEDATLAPATTLAPTVTFARSGRQVACAPGQTVLEAAASAGISLPSSCGEGMCGSCKSTLLGGKVDMQHQGGIRPREIAQDKFLPCCSTPDGDIEVDA